MFKVRKVCPIVVREGSEGAQILVFRHPNGDVQMVKGTLEPGEEPVRAALRELLEESGISGVFSVKPIGDWDSGFEDQLWHFFVCAVDQPLEDSWSFFANEDGGLDFEFFWHDIEQVPTTDWRPVFRDALEFVRSRL